MAPLTVYNLDRSRSYRIIWLLEELGTPFELKQYSRDPKGPHPPVSEGFKIHPLGKFPMIKTEDGEVIAETGIIFEYLCRQYDTANKLSAKAATNEMDKIAYWFHYAEGTIQLWGQVAFFFAVQKKDPPAKVLEEVNTNLKYLNDLLSKHEWLAGDKFTAADVCMEFPLEFIEALPQIDFSKYPKIQDFQKRIKQRPAYKKAIEKNGDYDLKSLYALF